jgi:hypothetical protein
MAATWLPVEFGSRSAVKRKARAFSVSIGAGGRNKTARQTQKEKTDAFRHRP